MTRSYFVVAPSIRSNASGRNLTTLFADVGRYLLDWEAILGDHRYATHKVILARESHKELEPQIAELSKQRAVLKDELDLQTARVVGLHVSRTDSNSFANSNSFVVCGCGKKAWHFNTIPHILQWTILRLTTSAGERARRWT